MDRRRLRRINQRGELRKRNLPRELNTVQLRIEPRGQVCARTQAVGRINHSDGASGVGYVDPHDGPLLSRGRLVVKRDSGRKRMVGAASSIEENLSRMDSCMHAITPGIFFKTPTPVQTERGQDARRIPAPLRAKETQPLETELSAPVSATFGLPEE